MEALPMRNSAANGETDAASSERRKQLRFECDGVAEVIVDNAGFLFRGKIRDFSLTGCYISSRAQLSLERGTEVELRFSVADDNFSTDARVIVVRPGAGAGFEFLNNDAELQAKLTRLIKRRDDQIAGRAPSSDAGPYAENETGPVKNLW
jgi:hypothetical protein